MKRKEIISAALSGVLFGIGLSLSGMANPAKVLAFLDITGDWDPSLAFVMAGALIPATLGFHLRKKDGKLRWVKREDPVLPVTKPLLAGALVFGLGWGLAGFCPGPAITGLAFLHPSVLLFTAAMFAGFALMRMRTPG